jgi:thiol-disulfide isomerase/thioredoxin
MLKKKHPAFSELTRPKRIRMQTIERRTLMLAGFVLAALAALPISLARAEDVPKPATDKPAEKPASAPAPARTPEAITADMQAARDEVKAVMPSPAEVVLDAKKRAEVGPKAIPPMKKFLAFFDELVPQDEMAKASSAQVRSQILSLQMALGDADAEKQLIHIAAGAGNDAVEARAALILTRWWLNSTDAAAQKKLLEDARALMKANAKNDSVAMTIIQMSEEGAASTELREAMQKIVIEEAEGPRGLMLARGIEAAAKLKSLEGKELTVAGVTYEGKQFTSADWKGKVVLVDFWATWCPQCRTQMPSLIKAYADFHEKGLEIVGISCDREAASLKGFLTEHKEISWPQLFDEKTPGWHPLATQLGMERLPTIFLLDRKGIVRTTSAQENFEEIIPKLIDEK